MVLYYLGTLNGELFSTDPKVHLTDDRSNNFRASDLEPYYEAPEDLDGLEFYTKGDPTIRYKITRRGVDTDDFFNVSWGTTRTNYMGATCRHNLENNNWIIDKRAKLDEIVGTKTHIAYKVKPEFVEFAIKMVGSDLTPKEWLEDNESFPVLTGDKWLVTFTKAGVLDLWFDKVYKHDLGLVIDGHSAIIRDKKVHFGCQSFTKETLEVLDDLLNRDVFSFTCAVNGKIVGKRRIKLLLNALKENI